MLDIVTLLGRQSRSVLALSSVTGSAWFGLRRGLGFVRAGPLRHAVGGVWCGLCTRAVCSAVAPSPGPCRLHTAISSQPAVVLGQVLLSPTLHTCGSLFTDSEEGVRISGRPSLHASLSVLLGPLAAHTNLFPPPLEAATPPGALSPMPVWGLLQAGSWAGAVPCRASPLSCQRSLLDSERMASQGLRTVLCGNLHGAWHAVASVNVGLF